MGTRTTGLSEHRSVCVDVCNVWENRSDRSICSCRDECCVVHQVPTLDGDLIGSSMRKGSAVNLRSSCVVTSESQGVGGEETVTNWTEAAHALLRLLSDTSSAPAVSIVQSTRSVCRADHAAPPAEDTALAHDAVGVI